MQTEVTDLDLESPADGLEAWGIKLRWEIQQHLLSLGFTEGCNGNYSLEGEVTKQRIRDLHSAQRLSNLEHNRVFVQANLGELIDSFASGNQIDPRAIDPELVEVHSNTKEAHLFRLASLLWSVPVSQGFGRRLRFLVRDRQNGCLIGIFALGDPVFNLSARDSWVNWTHEDRSKQLAHVMDAYVVGAVPPYSFLLGGKLVGSLMGSNEVQEVYERKYFNREGIISGVRKRAKLVLLTTMSALGRSSLYNRLRIPDGPGFERIGMTKGFGHFHLSDQIFESLRGYLEKINHRYASGHQFGDGPNWKIRVVRAALDELGVKGDSILKHGIGREVYAMPLATNWRNLLLGQDDKADPTTLPLSRIANFCRQRWMAPRATRDDRYSVFSKQEIAQRLSNNAAGTVW